MTNQYIPVNRIRYYLLCVCLLFAACGAKQAIPEEEASISRRQLSRNMWEKGEILYIYGTEARDSQADLSLLGENLSQAFQFNRGGRRGLKLGMYADSLVSEEMLKNNPIMLVGSPEGNFHLGEALKKLPITYQEGGKGFRFVGKSFTDSSEILLLSLYPNPWNEQYPIYVMTSLNPELISQVFSERYSEEWRGFLRDRWGYEVFKADERVIMGYFSDEEATRWKVDWDNHWDFTNRGENIATHLLVNFVVFEGAEDPIGTSRMAEELENARLRLEKMSSHQWDANKSIQFYLYPNTETKGLKTGITHQAHAKPHKLEIHAVTKDEFEGKNSEIPYELLAQELLGNPKYQALQTGLATYLTPNWQEKGYAYWASRLYEAESIPSARLLMNDEGFKQMSRLVRACMAGTWVEFLLAYWGEEAFFTQYSNWQVSEEELEKLDKKWNKYLAEIAKNHPKVERGVQQTSVYYKGFNFAHEGYRIYDGYLSEKANKSLKEMNSLGSNAAAIIPYSYMRNPNLPTLLPIPENSGSENDESVIRAAFNAQQLGMKTMLKPQLWVGRGSWPGEVGMENEADWEMFYQNYEEWMTHYALMAEIYEFDLLCVGVEFVKASQHNPEAWTDMIHRFRHIYQGPMTYAANWGDEFENLSIWEALDYIGIDCYYPLSKSTEPTDKELKKGFDKILKKIKAVSQKYDKPVIFTEIGYRSVKAAWIQPHEKEGDKPLSMECQERCYRVVAESLKNEDWVKGVFWWKWPSYLEYRGEMDRGFAPNSKPAAEVVKDWFGAFELTAICVHVL